MLTCHAQSAPTTPSQSKLILPQADRFVNKKLSVFPRHRFAVLFAILFYYMRLIKFSDKQPEVANLLFRVFGILLQAFVKFVIHKIYAAFGAILLKIEFADLRAALWANVIHPEHLLC